MEVFENSDNFSVCIPAPQVDGWSITAESITSTTILVTWSNVTHAIAIKDLYSFVAVCTAAGKKDATRLANANNSSSNVLVQTLRPYTDYQVQVVALLKGQRNGAVAMKSSSVVTLRTKEDGEISFKLRRLAKSTGFICEKVFIAETEG